MKESKYDPGWKQRVWRDIFEPLSLDLYGWAFGVIAAIVLLFVGLFLSSLYG